MTATGWTGKLLSIHITPAKSQPMQRLDEARLIERATGSTVREMRAWFKDPEDRPEAVQTARTVSIGEKLLFETTKMGIAYLNGKEIIRQNVKRGRGKEILWSDNVTL